MLWVFKADLPVFLTLVAFAIPAVSNSDPGVNIGAGGSGGGGAGTLGAFGANIDVHIILLPY